MIHTSTLNMLKNYYEVTNVPLQLFEDNTPILHVPKKSFLDLSASVALMNMLKKEIVCGYTVISGVMLVGVIQIEHSNKFILFGPTLMYSVAPNQYPAVLANLKQPISKTNEFQQWLYHLPVYDSVRFQRMLHFLDTLVNSNSDMRVQYLDPSLHGNEMEPITIHENHKFFKERMPIARESVLEQQLLSFVTSGNVVELQKTIHELFHLNALLDTHGLHADRYMKNIFIGCNSIVCRAAIRGGLSPSVSLSLSDYFISQVELCTSYDEVQMFLSQMFITYTKEVRNAKMPYSDSLLINKTIQYIQEHLYEPLSPTLIAKDMHVDLSYLCHHFKEKTNETITTYIHEIKIKESKRLIRTTNLTLAQIAMQLGYSSQNYFHTIFKKITGTTPKNYAREVYRP